MDPEDVVGLLGPYHTRVREKLEHFGGTVEKFIGDAVMAVFGAPVAHEDDPERAVRAALAIRDSARDEADGLELPIAVNTGEELALLDAQPDHGAARLGTIAGPRARCGPRLRGSGSMPPLRRGRGLRGGRRNGQGAGGDPRHRLRR